MKRLSEILRSVGRHPDLVLAGGVVGIIATLLVPLPTALLDLLLVLNIGLSLTLLITALHADRPLAISSFPSLLLIATLFRLALNVSSTRLILGTGQAGRVIEAFGHFVVQGSLLVGAVVFVILTVIQFLVVAKGSERVAEVSARFTLDAMPGKQLAIDADLRSGACTQEEGRARRAELERESQFYGALDGAMKFVKGDAIAGIVITLVNVVGGLTAGVLLEGRPLAEAARTYTLLSVGDGLVSQIPALLTAVAAGLIVTRVSGVDSPRLAGAVFRELGADPRTLAVVAAVSCLLGLAPGMPLVPFVLLGVGAAFAAWHRHRRLAPEAGASAGAPAAGRGADPAAAPETGGAQAGQGSAWAPPSSLVLTVSADADEAVIRRLVEEVIPALRERLTVELGLPIPTVRVRAGGPGVRSVSLILDEVPTGGLTLPSAWVLACDPEEADLMGMAGTRVQMGGQAMLAVDEETATQARDAGLPVLDLAGAAGRLLEAEIRAHAGRLLSLQVTQALLDTLERRAPAVVREVSKRVSVPVLCEALRQLLDEGVPLRNLERILEGVASLPEGTGEGPGAVERTVSRARRAVGRQLVAAHGRGGALTVYLLDPLVEDLLRSARVETEEGPVIALEPQRQGELLEALSKLPTGAVLLVAAPLRRYLWRVGEHTGRRLTVLAFEELPPDAAIQPVDAVRIPGLDPLAIAA